MWPASCCACSRCIRTSISPAIASDSQPDEAVARFFHHLAPVLPQLRFSDHDEILEYVAVNAQTAVFSAAPHGVSASLIDRLLASAESAGTRSARRGHLGRFPLPDGGRVRARLQARPRRARAHRAVHVRGSRTPRGAPDAARRPSRLLRHRDPARERSAARARPHRAEAVRGRHHGQHGIGTATDAGYASSRNVMAISTRTTRSRTATRPRCARSRPLRPVSMPSSRSCRTRGRSREAFT